MELCIAVLMLVHALCVTAQDDPPLIECSANPIISLDAALVSDLLDIESETLIVWAERVYTTSDIPEQCLRTNIGSMESVQLEFNLTDCNPEITEDDYFINVTYYVRNQKPENLSSPIQRYEDNCLVLTCSFDRKENLTVGGLVPSLRKNEIDKVIEEAEFEFEMNFYENCSFYDELDPLEVTVPDYVNVKVEIDDFDEADSDFVLQLVDCYATLNEDDKDPYYNLIENGCAADKYTDVIRNYESVYGTFKFRSFIWTNVMKENQEIFVHCEVCVCHDSDETPCEPMDCSDNRRRRDIIGSEKKQDSTLITSHRLRILQTEPESCLKKNGGCSDECMMTDDEVACGCFGTRQLGEDKKTCFYPERPRFNIDRYEESSGNQSMTTFVLLALVAILAVCLVFSIFSKREVVKF